MSSKIWRPAIEFNLTEHCNLACEHCDHASGVMPTKFASLDSFVADLAALSNVLEAGELKLLGGEPLLHPNCVDFVAAARASKISSRVVLVTNGVLLHKATPELWELLDGLWISIYPGIKHRFDWKWIQEMADRHEVFVWRKETPEFSVRPLIQPIENDDLVQMVYENCDLPHLFSCHTIHEGRYYPCSPAVWMEPRLEMHGIEFSNRVEDSVKIHDNPNLKEDLERLIRRKEPLKGCRFCLGSWARRTPNVQLSGRAKSESMRRTPQALVDLVAPEWIVPSHYLG